MKKNLFLICFVSTLFCFGQNKISRSGAASSKTNGMSPAPSSNIINETKKGTIIFKESGKAEEVVRTKTNGICGIFMFENVSEALEFAVKFKNSDSGIVDFYYTGVKNNVYYFNYSLNSPKTEEWYLSIFKQNGLSFVEYNGKSQAIQ
ncbi:MAG: hypothetical protein H7141_11500 [Burkholderiales bacterium]|nr:hypothetical protein [Bacteroidia bacterium]